MLTFSEATKANFSKAWGVLAPFYFKTILIALIGAVLETVISALLAYILVVKNFFFKEMIFMLFISVLLVPSIIGYPILIPLIRDSFKIGDTYFGYLLPMVGGAQVTGMFLFRTFFSQQPKSLYESAKLDGANELKIAFGIIAPLALPVITLVAVNTFIGTWNDFTGPLTYISRNASEKWTLAVAIYDRFRRAGGDIVKKAPQVQAALCVVMMIPSMILFAFFQKSLINGVSLSGIKG
jgi:ABC-type glycerol-3-phosphate transport system permease component